MNRDRRTLFGSRSIAAVQDYAEKIAVTLVILQTIPSRSCDKHGNGCNVDRSRQVFETLVRENEGPLVAWLRTMIHDSDLVDDLFQETLITAWQKFDEFDPSRSLGPWLRGIALNLARNAIRKQQRDALVFSNDVAESIEASILAIECADGNDWKEKTAKLSECLKQLSPRSRELLEARYEQGNNATQIAASSSSTPAGIRKQLQRIRSTLAKCMGLLSAEPV